MRSFRPKPKKRIRVSQDDIDKARKRARQIFLRQLAKKYSGPRYHQVCIQVLEKSNYDPIVARILRQGS